MSDKTINVCGNTLLKSVKMHFLVIPIFWGFKSPPIYPRGSEFIPFYKLVLLNLQNYDSAKKESDFFKKNAILDQKLEFWGFFRNS